MNFIRKFTFIAIKGIKYVPYGYYLKYGKINPKYEKKGNKGK